MSEDFELPESAPIYDIAEADRPDAILCVHELRAGFFGDSNDGGPVPTLTVTGCLHQGGINISSVDVCLLIGNEEVAASMIAMIRGAVKLTREAANVAGDVATWLEQQGGTDG